MASPKEFINVLNENELGPLVGVPCSIFAPLLRHALDNPSEIEYYNPANEAHAMGLAAGFYFGSKKIPVVFLQNSGIGNIIDPLTSLNQIYKIPAFLLISWPGAEGEDTDSPEYSIMCRYFEDYLKITHLPYEILSEENYANQIVALRKIARNQKIPVVAVVKRSLFNGSKVSVDNKKQSGLQRYDALKIIKESLTEFSFVSTNGITSRESFASKSSPDFYMVGSMGLISAIGCGTALSQQGKKVAVLDGDGGTLMHLGMLPFIGTFKPKNLFHFILDNQVYATTQNQPTVSPTVEFDKIALASGYRQAYKVESGEELQSLLASIKDNDGPVLVWIKIVLGNREGSGRVPGTLEEIRDNFMRAIGETAESNERL